MPANTNQIFPLTPKIGMGTLVTANTAKDGTGTQVTLFTAGANGAVLKRIRAVPQGTNTASVLRIFLNNGSTNATAANNTFFAQVTLAATTNTEIAALVPVELPNNLTIADPTAFPMTIPAAWVVNCTIGTTVAAGWAITAEYGDY